MDTLKRYKWAILLSVVLLITYIIKPELGIKATSLTWSNIKEMLSVLPPIFLILGLLDVWVSKETMIKLMGKGSGIKGGILAFFMGAAAAGPLYAAFPIAQMLLIKEASLFNVLIFIGAWSTTKIPMFLFETSALGIEFSLSRLLLNIPVIIIIAFLTLKAISPKEKDTIYSNVKAI